MNVCVRMLATRLAAALGAILTYAAMSAERLTKLSRNGLHQGRSRQ